MLPALVTNGHNDGHNGVSVLTVHDVGENGFVHGGQKSYPIEVLRNSHSLPSNVDPARREVEPTTCWSVPNRRQCDQRSKWKFGQIFQNGHSSFYLKWVIFQSSPKATVHLGYFSKKICLKKFQISKIAQSGHTNRQSQGSVIKPNFVCGIASCSKSIFLCKIRSNVNGQILSVNFQLHIE